MGIFHDTANLPSFKNASITIGTFDGVHQGHKRILQALVASATASGGESVVITFHPHPRKLLFPHQPLKVLTPLKEKLALLQASGINQIVVVPFTENFSKLSASAYIHDFLVANFHPAHIVIGYDHHFGHDRTGNIHLLREYSKACGYAVDEIPAQLIEEAAISSTKIRQAIAHGDIATANAMMERPYALTGLVVEGDKLGRTIGYPTANLNPIEEDQLIPANGVYACWATVANETFKAMVNIGYRPTVTNVKQLKIEAHLLGFDKGIYGQELSLNFIKKMRDEQKFPSLDALKAQLAMDKNNADICLEMP